MSMLDFIILWVWIPVVSLLIMDCNIPKLISHAFVRWFFCFGWLWRFCNTNTCVLNVEVSEQLCVYPSRSVLWSYYTSIQFIERGTRGQKSQENHCIRLIERGGKEVHTSTSSYQWLRQRLAQRKVTSVKTAMGY